MPLVIAFLARRHYERVAVALLATFDCHRLHCCSHHHPYHRSINMTIVMMPLIGLYFLSVGIAYLVYRRIVRDFSEEPFVKDDE